MSYSDRFSGLYLWSIPAETTVKLLADIASASGLSLTFPGTVMVSILSDYGEQSFITVDEFMQYVTDSSLTRFQYWWSDTDDLYCRIQQDGGVFHIDFALEGCSVAQEQRLWDCLKKSFVAFAETSTGLMLILDRTGRTAEYQWREIALGQTKIIPPYPDEIIIPKSSQFLTSIDTDYGTSFLLTPHAVAIQSIL